MTIITPDNPTGAPQPEDDEITLSGPQMLLHDLCQGSDNIAAIGVIVQYMPVAGEAGPPIVRRVSCAPEGWFDTVIASLATKLVTPNG